MWLNIAPFSINFGVYAPKHSLGKYLHFSGNPRCVFAHIPKLN